MAGFVEIYVVGRLSLSGGRSSDPTDSYQGGTASTTFTNTLSGGSAAEYSSVDGGSAVMIPMPDTYEGGVASTIHTNTLSGGGSASINQDEVSVQCLSLVPEIADALSAQGIDPSKVNSVEWPAYGASRWATATLLMSRESVDGTAGLKSILWDGGGGGQNLYVTLKFGTQTLPQMVPGRIIPVVLSESTSIYLVELHCRRWLWRNVRPVGAESTESMAIPMGYNLSGVSRGRMRVRSLNSGVPWTATEIVNRVLAGSPSNGYPKLTVANDTVMTPIAGLSIADDILVRDVSCDDSAPSLIDRVLAASGGMLAFTPTNGGASGYDIRIESIDVGEVSASGYLADYITEIIAGGVEAFVTDSALATVSNSGVVTNAVGYPDALICDCPKMVRVQFPFSISDNTDEVIGETDYAGAGGPSATYKASVFEGRFGSKPIWDSNNGDPFGTSYNEYRPQLWHVSCNVPVTSFYRDNSGSDDVLHSIDYSEVADAVAAVFYARYIAGCCDIWMRDFRPISNTWVWPGAQWWTWQMRQDGGGFNYPVTHIYGSRSSDLFGYQAISGPEPVLGFGNVSAYRGGDNAIRVIGHQIGPVPCMIRIKSAVGTTTYEWEYTAVLLQRDDAATGGWVEGQTVTALNTVERNNSASFAGPSVKIPLSAAPSFEPLAIGYDRDSVFHEVDVIALLVEDRKYAGGRVAYFSLDNTVDGPC